MATAYLADDIKRSGGSRPKVLRCELAAVVAADRFLAEIKAEENPQYPHILPLAPSGTVCLRF